MPTTNKPLPSRLLDNVSDHAGASLLARHLHGIMNQSRTRNSHTLARDAEHGIMEGVLVVACTSRFDPDETVSVRRRGEDETISLLQAVLELTHGNQMVRPTRVWPEHLDSFTPDLKDEAGNLVPVDGEWMAAMFVAAGCNPWKDASSTPLEVETAVDLNLPGLLRRMMSLEGAANPDQVLMHVYNGTKVLTLLAQDPDRSVMLNDLTQDGIGHWSIDRDMVDVITHACPDGISVLLNNGLDLSSKSVQEYLAKGWLERVKQGTLDPVICARLHEKAFGRTGHSMDAETLEIKKSLSVDWGSRPNGSTASAYGFMTNTGAQTLCGVGEVKAGPMAGRWSVLAGAVMSRIRQADPAGAQTTLGTPGCRQWSSSNMVHCVYDEQKKKWVSAQADHPDYIGCLDGSIGFEWRKGISIDGVVALGLWGQEDKKDENLDAMVADFALMAGIDDISQWSRQSANDAVKFTQAIIKNNASSAASAMASTWAQALSRCPDMLEALDYSQRVDLVQTLTCNFHDTSMMEEFRQRNAMKNLVARVFDGISWSQVVAAPMPPSPEREACVLLALLQTCQTDIEVHRRREILDALGDCLARPETDGGATPREKSIIDAWIKAPKASPDIAAGANALSMLISTPAATARAPKPRRM